MKYLLRTNSEGDALDCYKDKCAWPVIDLEIEGSVTKVVNLCNIRSSS